MCSPVLDRQPHGAATVTVLIHPAVPCCKCCQFAHLCWADCLTELARDAALLACGVAAQDVLTPESGADGALLKGVVDLGGSNGSGGGGGCGGGREGGGVNLDTGVLHIPTHAYQCYVQGHTSHFTLPQRLCQKVALLHAVIQLHVDKSSCLFTETSDGIVRTLALLPLGTTRPTNRTPMLALLLHHETVALTGCCLQVSWQLLLVVLTVTLGSKYALMV